jgi:hypothetical protein
VIARSVSVQLAGSRPPRVRAAPSGLAFILLAYPALTRWAFLCRRCAAPMTYGLGDLSALKNGWDVRPSRYPSKENFLHNIAALAEEGRNVEIVLLEVRDHR